jgi:caffeoyl-CoA O-methyltransferase
MGVVRLIAGLRRIRRAPALHFLVLGALLFEAHAVWTASPDSAPRPPIVVTAADLERGRREWARREGVQPTEAPADGEILDDAIDNAVLLYEAMARAYDRRDPVVRARLLTLGHYLGLAAGGDDDAVEREARALGLQRSDETVRRHLVEMMRLAAAKPGPADLPDEAQLKAYYQTNRERFAQPARVTLTQVYLSRERHGDHLDGDAREMLVRLQRDVTDPPSAHDPFLRRRPQSPPAPLPGRPQRSPGVGASPRLARPLRDPGRAVERAGPALAPIACPARAAPRGSGGPLGRHGVPTQEARLVPQPLRVQATVPGRRAKTRTCGRGSKRDVQRKAAEEMHPPSRRDFRRASDAAMKYTAMTPQLYDYLVRHGHNADPLLAELAKETEALGPIAMMQIAPEQGTLLSILVRAIGARRAVEVGTFTGYSALCIARGLPPDGTLLCCDINEEWTAMARRYWSKAGLADRIELRLAPAADTIRALPANHTIDFAFIDADKVSYRDYYDALLPRLRPNGLIVFDNVLWGGQVLDTATTSDQTKALQALNDFIATDQRVDAVMLSVSDGLTIVRKRAAGER